MPIYDPQSHYEQEAPIIASYVQDSLDAVNMTYDANTGIWYSVDSVAGGDYSYEQWPDITVKFKGKLLDGTVFDGTDNLTNYPDSVLTVNLSNLIDAWKLVFIPKEVNGTVVGGLTVNGLQKGAKVKFVTPSPLAYQDVNNGMIPANSPLYFEIEVLDIKAPSTI